jgi:muramoyltetrapeptide carboxypeptidase LdcA involved in peptidoglycan recycling
VTRAPALRPGGTIGVVAPSWCGPALHPHRVERGVRFLESLGYRVLLGRHAMGRRGYAFPILADVDFGHTAPQLTLPIGCRAELDVAERRFAVLEAAVSG